MAVNYQTPSADRIFAVAGVCLGSAEGEIRKKNRRDVTLITLSEGSSVAGVFTQNRFCAAPVSVCRRHLAAGGDGGIRALLINTGIANAGTGAAGMAAAEHSCRAVGERLNVPMAAVLPFSTGVILEPLPVDRLLAALPAAQADLGSDSQHWLNAAHAIMTTDTVAKVASRQISVAGKTVNVTGMSKGSGMIHPNMATMLGFIATDAGIAQDGLASWVKAVADQSFNCITVDGDTSTNDSLVVMATGQSGVHFSAADMRADNGDWQRVQDAVFAVAAELAQAMVRDGEGASKFITIHVQGGKSREECRQVAYAIAHSPLVKTAFFASDPNLGRILAAIGYAGVTDLDVNRVRVMLDDVLVAENGGRAASYREEDGQRIMAQAEITVTVDLARAEATATVYTCDLSHDYVSINADYRS